MPKLVKRAGGILIHDKKVLVERSRGKTFFIPPGGQVDPGESMKQALIRELFEELQIRVEESDLEEFNTYLKPAGGQEDYDVQMDAFLVNNWTGKITPDNELEEIAWVDSNSSKGLKLGSIFESEVLPKLVERGLIN